MLSENDWTKRDKQSKNVKYPQHKKYYTTRADPEENQ